MKKKIVGLLLSALLVFMLFGCSQPAETSDDAAGGEPAATEEAAPAEDEEADSGSGDTQTLKVGYTVQSMENAYFVSIVDGMKAAAKEMGIDLIVADAAADASKHIDQIEDFISQEVDAIIISPVDQEAPVDVVKKAKDAGIAVISLDQEVAGSDAFYGIDEATFGELGGVLGGKWLNEKEEDGTIDEILNDEGQIEVVIVRYDVIPSLIRRSDGLKNGLETTYTGDKEIVYVYEQNAADADTGYSVAETALTANPGVAMFLCINDSSALGVYEACLTHKEHTPDNTCIIGLDALDEALKLISQDTMYKGTVDIKPAEKGADVLELVKEVLANGPIEEQIVYEMSAVSKENIGEYDIAE